MRRWRFLLWVAVAVGLVGLVGLVAVVARPASIDPVAYRPVEPIPLEGALAVNDELARVELLGSGHLLGPEDVEPVDVEPVDAAPGEAPTLLTGNADGSIRRLLTTADGWGVELVADTGGRPLGLDRDAGGTLWVADAERGLLAVDPRGHVRVAVAEAAGARLAFADDVATGPDGRVYVSDASRRHGAAALLLETLEARPWGRLVEHDPATGRSRVLLDDLYFANGVAVAPDGRFVLVAETFRYRVRRYWLAGPRAGESEIFVDRLPGFPDGISSDGRGGFWLALYSLRSTLLDRLLHPRPALKRFVARLPGALQPRPRAYGLVVHLDGDGRVLSSLHDPGGERFPFVTSVEEHGGALYLGSVESDAVGRHRLGSPDGRSSS